MAARRGRWLLTVALLAWPRATAAAQCVGPAAPVAIAARDSLRSWFRADSAFNGPYGFWRSYQLSRGAREIVIVDDPARCRGALAAIKTQRGRDLTNLSPVVIRAGARYLVLPAGEFTRGWPWHAEFDSTMTLLLPRDRLSTVVTGGGPDPQLPASESRCHDGDLGYTKTIAGKIRKVLTDPRQLWYRDLLGITGASIDSVTHVGPGLTCSLAIQAIQAHYQRPDRAVQVALFRVGDVLWADVSYPRIGEWTLVFILDRSGTKVLGQY